MQVEDQLHRAICFQETPKRIVSLVPSLTELLCDLGLKTSLVGVTKFCVHPKTVRQDVEVVGGTKQVHFNKIKELKPDIILCNKEENTLQIVEECIKIAPVHISDIYTVNDCLELIAMYGEIFNVKDKSSFLIKSILEKQSAFQNFMLNKSQKKVAYFIWKTPWMVAGNKTFVNHLLQKNKFNNVFSVLNRYPEITLNDKELSEVEIVLLSSEPYPFKKAHKKALEKQFPKAKVLMVDGEMFSWYGSRLVKAFGYFKELHSNTLQ